MEKLMGCKVIEKLDTLVGSRINLHTGITSVEGELKEKTINADHKNYAYYFVGEDLKIMIIINASKKYDFEINDSRTRLSIYEL